MTGNDRQCPDNDGNRAKKDGLQSDNAFGRFPVVTGNDGKCPDDDGHVATQT